MLVSTLDGGKTSVNHTKHLLAQGEKQQIDPHLNVCQHEKVLEKGKARCRD